MIKLKSLIKEHDDSVIEKFISILPKYDLEYHSWDSGDKSATFQWRNGIYPTITDKDRIVKVGLDRTDIFGRNGNVYVGNSSRPLLNGYVVQAIVTDPQHRGKGKANEILKKILLAADEVGLLLKLEPVPMNDFIKKGDAKLSQPQLTKWYSKHGFEKQPDANIMTRNPKKINESEKRWSAIVIDDASRNSLLSKYKNKIPEKWEVIAHHCTINPFGLTDDVGKSVNLKITEFGIDDKAMAVKVTGYDKKTNNNFAHITIAINRIDGGKPKDSNNIKQWIKVEDGLTLHGTIENL